MKPRKKGSMGGLLMQLFLPAWYVLTELVDVKPVCTTVTLGK